MTLLQHQIALWDTQSADNPTLPLNLKTVKVPALKCQGIKTKLVAFILRSIKWNGAGRWVEPFVGTGSLVFNLKPRRALLADTNVHIIRLYHDLAGDIITPSMVRRHLETEGRLLARKGADHYYEIRERFNTSPSSLDFIFLNRSCFNGVMRFNKSGKFNVPFCHKLDRFRPAYVSKIVNQVAYIHSLLKNPEWKIEQADYLTTLNQVQSEDFVYVDPPYLGRHTDYYNSWSEADASALLARLQVQPAGFALSSWKSNKYRINPEIANGIEGTIIRTTEHFYYVGSNESFRNAVEEALIIRTGFEVTSPIED